MPTCRINNDAKIKRFGIRDFISPFPHNHQICRQQIFNSLSTWAISCADDALRTITISKQLLMSSLLPETKVFFSIGISEIELYFEL